MLEVWAENNVIVTRKSIQTLGEQSGKKEWERGWAKVGEVNVKSTT